MVHLDNSANTLSNYLWAMVVTHVLTFLWLLVGTGDSGSGVKTSYTNAVL